MRLLPPLLAFGAALLIAAGPLVYNSQRSVTYRNFRVVEEGVLYRSGQMTSAGFERVCRERGIRTVIKLREENAADDKDKLIDDREEDYCEANGIHFHRITPKKQEGVKDPFVLMGINLANFEELMKDEQKAPRPVLIHCFAGIHRTGSHVAVYRMKFCGWTNEQAVNELKECGTLTTRYDGDFLPYLLNYRPKP